MALSREEVLDAIADMSVKRSLVFRQQLPLQQLQRQQLVMIQHQ